MTFEELLKYINDEAKSTREKGELFEIAIKKLLKQSPEHDFEDVWMWSEWTDLKNYNFTRRDTGIDLVTKEKETGNYWAIQCKCFKKDHQIRKEHIDSFLGLAGKEPFKTKLIVTTTNNWSQNASDAIKDRTKSCKTLKLNELEDMNFDWTLQKPKERLTPLDHQEVALQKAKEHFKQHDRGQMIMACGTGKTLTSLYIAEQLTPKDGHILFLAPSISLISQSLRQYAYQRSHGQKYLVVC